MVQFLDDAVRVGERPAVQGPLVRGVVVVASAALGECGVALAGCGDMPVEPRWRSGNGARLAKSLKGMDALLIDVMRFGL
ncbi:hypothetical protein [Streptomyces sp. B8F3]|uniref:hypothetical protein n=1 Tax=unclassified Streptomyces TaxID=2593676 RepID=UPI00325EAD87